ncbi:hypothetical protein NXC14_CH01207 [Rhizobium sp. NXC14]|nr:hypothetical protein NXC14_CH01207 [Rhizobium sp. NXC14]
MGLRTQANAKWDSFKLKLRFDRSLRRGVATTLTDLRLRYIEGMDKIHALLIVAAAIAIIFLAGRWKPRMPITIWASAISVRAARGRAAMMIHKKNEAPDQRLSSIRRFRRGRHQLAWRSER